MNEQSLTPPHFEYVHGNVLHDGDEVERDDLVQPGVRVQLLAHNGVDAVDGKDEAGLALAQRHGLAALADHHLGQRFGDHLKNEARVSFKDYSTRQEKVTRTHGLVSYIKKEYMY